MMKRLAPLLLILGLVAGAFVGRLMAHHYGGPFSLPQRPDPNQWRVISPGLDEGIGRSGAGRVTHVVDGALSIATHVFFRPDMVIPQFRGEAHSVDVELASDSGTLLLQIGASNRTSRAAKRTPKGRLDQTFPSATPPLRPQDWVGSRRISLCSRGSLFSNAALG